MQSTVGDYTGALETRLLHRYLWLFVAVPLMSSAVAVAQASLEKRPWIAVRSVNVGSDHPAFPVAASSTAAAAVARANIDAFRRVIDENIVAADPSISAAAARDAKVPKGALAAIQRGSSNLIDFVAEAATPAEARRLASSGRAEYLARRAATNATALRRTIPNPSSRAVLQAEAQRLHLELLPQIRPVVSGAARRAPRDLLGPAKKAVVIGAALALALAVLAEGVLRIRA